MCLALFQMPHKSALQIVFLSELYSLQCHLPNSSYTRCLPNFAIDNFFLCSTVNGLALYCTLYWFVHHSKLSAQLFNVFSSLWLTYDKLFGFEIEPGREIILNVVDKEIKNKVMEEITKTVSIKTPGKGICISLPVDSAIGISDKSLD